jgi:hypothetical protein
MAEENKPTTPPANTTPEDPTKNLKAEYDRKFTNLESTLTQTNKALQALLESQRPKQPEPTEGKPSIKDLWYSDEEKAAEVIADQAADRALKVMNKQNEHNMRIQQTAQDIANEYPEAVDPSSDLILKAREIMTSYSKEEQGTPMAMKLAVREAAALLDIKPKSKRGSNPANDAFALGGHGSSSSRRQQSQSEPENFDNTLEFAAYLGLNVDDPKVKESLANRAKEIKGRNRN